MKAANRQFTGRHASAIIVVFFAVVVAVNFTMARLASSTFGGVVVENSYVASQQFNRWLDEAHQEAVLGWEVQAVRRADGRIALTLAGAGKTPPEFTGQARHPLGHSPDQALHFAPDGGRRYLSAEPLAPGRWQLRLEGAVGPKRWRRELEVR